MNDRQPTQRKGRKGGPVGGYRGTLFEDARFHSWDDGKAVLTFTLAMHQVDAQNAVIFTEKLAVKIWDGGAIRHHATGMLRTGVSVIVINGMPKAQKPWQNQAGDWISSLAYDLGADHMNLSVVGTTIGTLSAHLVPAEEALARGRSPRTPVPQSSRHGNPPQPTEDDDESDIPF